MKSKQDTRSQMMRIVSTNLSRLRNEKYPGRGGKKSCSEALGLKQQQWTPWEKGVRLPNDDSLAKIAELFGVTVEYLKTDHAVSADIKAEVRATESHDAVLNDLVQGVSSVIASNLAKKSVASSVEQHFAAMNLDKIKAVLQLELSIVGFKIKS